MESEWSEEKMRSFVDARVAEALALYDARRNGTPQVNEAPESNNRKSSLDESNETPKSASRNQAKEFEEKIRAVSLRMNGISQQLENRISELGQRLKSMEDSFAEAKKIETTKISVEKPAPEDSSPGKLAVIEREINEVRSSLNEYYEKLMRTNVPNPETKQLEEVKRLHADFLEMIRSDQSMFRVKIEQKCEAISSSLNKSMAKLCEESEGRMRVYTATKIEEGRVDPEVKRLLEKHEENFVHVVENFSSIKLAMLKVQEETRSNIESLQQKMKSVWDTVTLLSQSLLAVERQSGPAPTAETITGSMVKK
eukprot:TRINITY_DN649_c0_g1_i1.p2 TRINITY_DN649_c0_g1~~TRINITY_DN649_c0_g1_i1.p2  ORF type:complete len:311 (-),score=66.75 TRINITY_DN649_c0_g1_i1:1360-2292(-)